MFSQACVILFTGWGSASVHAGIPPPPSRYPAADTPQPQSMLGDTVNAWAVCILLECNFVLFDTYSNQCLPFLLWWCHLDRVCKLLVNESMTGRFQWGTPHNDLLLFPTEANILQVHGFMP